MKIGEWDSLGHARGLLQRQLGELGAVEYAAHVTVAESGKQRILVATDVGLLDYSWSSSGSDPWLLRGQIYRWPNIRALRLQTDAQWDEDQNEARSLWRLTADEPKIELVADSVTGGHDAVGALLALARACLQHAE